MTLVILCGVLLGWPIGMDPVSVWASGKSVYCVQRAGGGAVVRRFVEKADGFKAVGAPVRLRTHVLGFGPGQGDSLLVLSAPSKGPWVVSRLVGGAVRRVCGFPFETQWMDPEFSLFESQQCMTLQSLRSDEMTLTNTWLYRKGWAGPLIGNSDDFRVPTNEYGNLSLRRVWNFHTKEFHWGVSWFRPDESMFQYHWDFSSPRIGAHKDQLSNLQVLPSLSRTRIAMFDSGGQWIVTIGDTKLVVWAVIGQTVLGDPAKGVPPLVQDAHGRLWEWAGGGRFRRLQLKQVATQDVVF